MTNGVLDVPVRVETANHKTDDFETVRAEILLLAGDKALLLVVVAVLAAAATPSPSGLLPSSSYTEQQQ